MRLMRFALRLLLSTLLHNFLNLYLKKSSDLSMDPYRKKQHQSGVFQTLFYVA